jgi:hypothetical protein
MQVTMAMLENSLASAVLSSTTNFPDSYTHPQGSFHREIKQQEKQERQGWDKQGYSYHELTSREHPGG